MKKPVISLIIAALLLFGGIFVFNSKLDIMIYTVLIVILLLTYNYNVFYRLFFVVAGALLIVSVTGYFLDPRLIKLTHYIFKPSIWVYYFLFAGSLSSLIVNLKKND